jgi:MFS transporter, ACS family, hexuronate transporter
LSTPAAPPDVAPPSAAPRSNAWKWWLTIVLFLATVLTYLDRQTMSLCASMICKEFRLSDQQYGELVSAFRWAYAIMHIPAGFLADRVPLRMTYGLAVVLWSAAGAAALFVRNGAQLLVTRGVLGMGEAFNWPCATRIVATMLPPEDRGLASGIFNSGAAVGSLIAPWVILPIAIFMGWRWAFYIIGVIGLLWVLLWLVATLRGSSAHGAVNRAPAVVATHAEKHSVLISLSAWSQQVLLHPAFWMLFVVAITVNPCWYFLNEWIPKYLHDQRGFGYLKAGLFTTPIFLAADAGNLLSGGLIKFLTVRGWPLRNARRTTLALAGAMVLPVALVPHLSNPYFCIALLALGALGITSIVANYTACQGDFSFANVGIVAGILGMSSNVFAALGNPRIGAYVDSTGTYNLIFLLVAVVPLISVAAIAVFDTIIHPPERKT